MSPDSDRGGTISMIAQVLCQLTGERSGVVALPRDDPPLAARVLRGQLDANYPVITISGLWDGTEPRFGLYARHAYEVRGVSPGGLARLHTPWNRHQAQPRPLPVPDFLDLTRAEIATLHPEYARERLADEH